MDSSESWSFHSPSRPGWAYDVFLSFRGEDTRKSFTDHLYTALVQAGIHTFRDNDELPRGENISSHILNAIQESKISVVVFSKGYASSTWCLDELAKILECKTTIGQIVLPIFYDIDPSDVRKQKRSFAEAFDRHEERFKEEIDKVDKWKGALVEAANLSGWDLHSTANGHESEFVQKIVQNVLSRLNHKYLNVGTHPVGIVSQVKDIINVLLPGVGSDDVHTFGIYGMPGIGKTTIAKALFNQLCHRFEGSCCLLNIKRIAEQPNGLVQLQKQLLYDALKQKPWIHDVDQGIIWIRERFGRKRVLVVLDDVDQLEQLNALVGERSWFGLGSRIIVTTRDERLLTQVGVDQKYKVKELTRAESLQLFSWHAFGRPYPVKEYFELSKGVIDYVGGLPLALQVLGSYLFKRSIIEWKSAIKKLRKIPHHQIQSQLRTSFDSLDDDKLKDMFLDIVCFFIGMDREYVTRILDARGFFSEIGLNILIERSLVTINNQNELKVHDLLRDMGREIVRQMAPNQPGKRSRLWSHEEVFDVLKKHKGTKVVEGLALDVQASGPVVLSTKSFARMRYLQLLQCKGVHISGCNEQLFKELTWLCWHKCPLQSLPPSFQLDNLTVLDMQYSLMKEVWKDIKLLKRLRILDLSHSEHLIKSPDFTGLSNLERLILEGCTSLLEVHHSIGHLKRLVFLNLEGCWKLDHLPESICCLKSLETLNISMCSRLRILPQHLGMLKNLRNLLLGSPICSQVQSMQLPYSEEIVIKFPKFPPFLPASFVGLSSMRRLDLRNRRLSDIEASINFGSLSSLQDLNLAGNKFSTLPIGIGCLPKLEKLNLCCCRNLLSISELPSSLKTLEAYYCTSMKKLSIHSKTVPDLLLNGCEKLVEIEGLEYVENKPVIYMGNCKNLSNNFKKILLQVLSRCKLPEIVFPGSNIPDWFRHHGEGSSMTFNLPPDFGGEIQGLIVCAVYAEREYGGEPSFSSVTIKEKRAGTELFYTPSFFPVSSIDVFFNNKGDHSWVIYVPFNRLQCAMEGGEEIEVCVKIGPDATVKKCGVHLVLNQPEFSMTTYTSLCSFLKKLITYVL